MRLLFITERIDENDDDLAFVIQWINAFVQQGFSVEVICLKKGAFNGSFPVYSLGKERGVGKLFQLYTFLRLIVSLRYDRVFVHLSPFYLALGSPWWVVKRTPVYLWYTHYTMTVSMWISGFVARRLFAATPQSLPHYEGNPKKTIVNHGVDPEFWKPAPDVLLAEGDSHKLVAIHRLSRSKRVELSIESLKYLPTEYTLTLYGRALDAAYFAELQELVEREGLSDRVFFKGPVPMPELRNVYPHYRLMINMAYETIDKTMLEAMLYGIYPVTTAGNSKAIGLLDAPQSDTPRAIAEFILSEDWKKHTRTDLREHVIRTHSLSALIAKMSSYIEKGI